MNDINVIKEIRKIRADFFAEQLMAKQRSEQDLVSSVKEFCSGKSQAFTYAYKLLDKLISKYEKEKVLK